MSDLTSQVGPETKAIIWFSKSDIDSSSLRYKELDYLCDGILTSSLQSLQEKSSLVLFAKNYGSSLMVFVVKELIKKELESFLSLLPKDSTGDILVVDDGEILEEVKGLIPATAIAKFKRVT